MRSPVAWTLVVGVALCAARPDAAQAPSPLPQTPQFRAGVDLVELDVSVLDKDRHPVRGLTAKDFTILEDGTPQDVSSFSAVDIPPSSPPTAAWMATASADLATNDTRDRRMFVLYIDDAIIGGDLTSLQLTSQAAGAFIDQLGVNDLAAVAYSWDSTRALGFTSDHGKLRAAVANISAGPGASAKGQCGALWASTGTLRGLTEVLMEVPHRRKAIVEISPGPVLDWSERSPDPCQPRAVEDAKAAFANAQRGNVAIYGVDPQGLKVLMAFDAAHPPAPGTDVTTLAPPSSLDVGDFLLTAASNTGGRVIMNTNEPMQDVHEIIDENGSYYLLGYVSTNAKKDGTYRRLDVKVDRPDVVVRARSGYTAPKPPSAPGETRSVLASVAALADIVPKSDLPLGVTVAPFADATGHPTLAMILQVQPPTSAEGGVDHLDLVAQAFTNEGKPSGAAHQNVSIVTGRKSDPKMRAAFEVISQMPIGTGHFELRLGVARESLSGSVHTSVDVPDFMRDKVSLSGMLLTASPALPIAPKDELREILPPDLVPTAVRDFTPDIAVSAFARVYAPAKGSAADVALHYTIRDDHDRLLSDDVKTVPAANFVPTPRGPKQFDLRVALPIAKLPPGAYLFSLDATIGKTVARRELQFRVH